MKLGHARLLERQAGRREAAGPLRAVAVANNIRSLYNVGSIFRTADGAGFSKLYLTGISGTPPDRRIAKTALGAEEALAWEYRPQGGPLLDELRAQGYQIAVLEQTTDAISIFDWTPRFPVALVIGNEIKGVSAAVLERADVCLEIPMRGVKLSLNTAVAFGIASFHLLETHTFEMASQRPTSRAGTPRGVGS